MSNSKLLFIHEYVANILQIKRVGFETVINLLTIYDDDALGDIHYVIRGKLLQVFGIISKFSLNHRIV